MIRKRREDEAHKALGG